MVPILSTVLTCNYREGAHVTYSHFIVRRLNISIIMDSVLGFPSELAAVNHAYITLSN